MANLHNNISDGKNFTAEDAGNTFGVDGGIAFGGSTNSANEKGQITDECKSLGGGKSVGGSFAKTTDGREKVGEGANVDGGLANTTDGREGMYCYKYPHPALTVDCVIFGYMIAVLSVISPLKRATFIAAITPIVALAIPIFDTLFAIVRRSIKRIPILEGDKGHLHHRLMKAGYGQRRSVLIIYGIVGIMGMVSVLISRELYKDAFFLSLIAVLYLCVILIEKKPKNKHHVTTKPKTEEHYDVIKGPKEIHDDRD